MSVVSEAGNRHAVDATAAALMIGLTFSWGLNYVAAKISYAGFNPVFLSIARSLIGGACVLAWCRWRGLPLFTRDGTLSAGIAVGVLFGLEFLCLYVGLEHTTVARNTLLVNSMPFWMLVAGHFLLGETMNLGKLFGLALAFCGLVLVFSDRLGGGALLGDVLSLASGALWASTNVVIKRSKLPVVSPEKLLLYQLAGAAVVGALVMSFAGAAIRNVSALPVTALLFQAIFVVAFTYVLWFWLLGRYPASDLSSFAFLTPVFGVLCGYLFLSEPLNLRVFAALVLIAAGIVVVNRSPRRQIVG